MSQSAASVVEDNFVAEGGDEPVVLSTVREERRRMSAPTTMIGYLAQLSANTLLHRLPTPLLAVCDDGFILYANPACHAMLGTDDAALAGQPLNQFLDVGSSISPPECVRVLREAAGDVIAWCHPEVGIVHAVVSQPMLLRTDDPVLLVALIDVTEWMWTFGSDSTPHVFRSADRCVNPPSTTGLEVVR
ncbi:MAG: PAS domain-containing protein [Mycobacterium sp.]|nr:PAS domain-containing protein [Mycobacterium sp.]